MTPVREASEPAGALYRVGHLPDPPAWPDWRYVGGGRFDDFQRMFRTLHAAEQRLACFVELLAAFRPSPHTLALSTAVVGTDGPTPLARSPPTGHASAAFVLSACSRASAGSMYVPWLHPADDACTGVQAVEQMVCTVRGKFDR